MKIFLPLLSVLISFSYSQQLTQVVKTYENGQKWSEGDYKDGKVDGSYTFYYENGQKSYELNYKDGIQIGLSTGWY
jgi:antitoxin component YwqK of YwqJK toxin-antitoxin module